MTDETTSLLPTTRWREPSKGIAKGPWILGAWAVLATVLALYSSGLPRTDDYFSSSSSKRNVIFMVSDGMGPASLSLTRSFRQFRDNLPYDDILSLDEHFIGQSRTRSSDSLITDSAAGATAFACGHKSYNGAIGVFPNTAPCGTVLEAAKMQGYMTGLVVTTRITDATPAAFSAHVNTRSEEDRIAEHQLGKYPLGRMVDLIIGGGRCHFLPKSVSGGCRHDSRNLVEEAVGDGWTYVEDLDGYNSLKSGKNVSLPLLALLAPIDIPFEIDREENVHPSLESTTKTALKALERATKHSKRGFFLMVEGSRIDHAGHANDPAAQVREVLAYDAAFRAAVEFAKKSKTETIVISTSDHETGGLATARQLSPSYPDYLWYPEALANATHSADYLSSKLKHYRGDDLRHFVETTILREGLGIPEPSQKDVGVLVEKKNNANDAIAEIVSLRSQTGWSTHGHSAVDVNIYAYSPVRRTYSRLLSSLGGNNENTDIGKFLAEYLSVDVDSITEYLQKNLIKDDFGAMEDLDAYHAEIYQAP
jgi:alkaline phosphatase